MQVTLNTLNNIVGGLYPLPQSSPSPPPPPHGRCHEPRSVDSLRSSKLERIMEQMCGWILQIWGVLAWHPQWVPLLRLTTMHDDVLDLRANSHRVSSPNSTHVSKFQHGGKVPTFEPQNTIKIWSILIKGRILIILCNMFAGLVFKVGSSFLLNATRNTSPKPQPPKTVAMSTSMSFLGLRT